METKRWVLHIEGERHNVIARWEYDSGAGEVWDNGKLVDSWKSLAIFSPSRRFLLGEKDAVLKCFDPRSDKWDLYLAGELVAGELVGEDDADSEGTTPEQGTKRWVVSTHGEQHEVVLDNWESWDGAGELWVDHQLVDSWKFNFGPRSFRIGETDAVLHWEDNRCKLYVAGELIREELVTRREIGDIDFCAILKVWGTNAQMAAFGIRPERQIEGTRPFGFWWSKESLGLIDIAMGPVHWVNLRKLTATSGGPHGDYTSERYYTDYGVHDLRVTDFPKVWISLVQVNIFPLIGPVRKVIWKGQDFGLGIIDRLNADRSLKNPIMGSPDLQIWAEPKHGCWIISTKGRRAPTRTLWSCYQSIANHLLTWCLP